MASTLPRPEAGFRTAAPESGQRQTLNLACVQVRVRAEDFAQEEVLSARIDDWMRRIRERVGPMGRLLVAFPEDIGTFTAFFGHGDLLRAATGMEDAVRGLIRRRRLEVLTRRLRCRVGWVRALTLARSREVEAAYRRLFSQAARRWRAFVVAGSAVLAAPDRPCCTYNVSYVFGPNGELLGWQPKTHLTPIEGPDGLDITPAPVSALQVIPTAIGTLGMAICLDAFQEAVIQRLVDAGADVLVQPSANPGPWTPEQQLDWKRSSWQAVRRWPALRYALNPMMVGEILGLVFEGQSSICAGDPALWEPGGYLDLGQEEGGFVRVARTKDQEELLVASVPAPVLARSQTSPS